MTPTEYMAAQIVDFVRSRGGSLFHEIVQHIGTEAVGTGHLHFLNYPNVVLWANVSKSFVDAINMAFPLLEFRRANPVMYVYFSDDVGYPCLPVVSAKDYANGTLDFEEKRWLPLVFFVLENTE